MQHTPSVIKPCRLCLEGPFALDCYNIQTQSTIYCTSSRLLQHTNTKYHLLHVSSSSCQPVPPSCHQKALEKGHIMGAFLFHQNPGGRPSSWPSCFGSVHLSGLREVSCFATADVDVHLHPVTTLLTSSSHRGLLGGQEQLQQL